VLLIDCEKMTESSKSSSNVSRRQALGVLGGLVVGGVVGAAGGYYAGMSSVPSAPAAMTSTVTQTVTGAASTVTVTGAAAPLHFSDLSLWYFNGGNAGDIFASICHKGSVDARNDLGCKVTDTFSGWDVSKMVDQFREALAAKPDGICVMGHPGEAALGPLIDQAFAQGTAVTIQNVDLPNIRAKYATQGCGYVGQILQVAGASLAQKAIVDFGLKPGDKVLVLGKWGSPGRMVREAASADTFTKAGMVVDKVLQPDEWASAPEEAIPVVSGYIEAHPDLKLIEWAEEQGEVSIKTIMDQTGKAPGDIKIIGFDLAPPILDLVLSGYIQLHILQEPYYQGYFPIANLCMAIKYKLIGVFMDTGAGFMTKDNSAALKALAQAGIQG
jgi:simple sugar transport system substrate-binding protein